MNDRIVCCIFNYNHDENSKRWYTALKNDFDTYILDSYHRDNGDIDRAFNELKPDDHIIFFNNIYFGGLFYETYKISVNRGARWMIVITSDLEIDDENLERLKHIVNDEIFDNIEIGTYQPSAKLGSCCYGLTHITQQNAMLYNQHTNNIRESQCCEDWFFMCRVSETHHAFNVYKTGEYYYGWGIGWYINETIKLNGYKCVIDDRVEVYNPPGCGYNQDEASRQYSELVKRFSENHYELHVWDWSATFMKDVADKDKYLVITCAKHEDRYLVEFVEHYLNMGFDKIIIADNNDEPTIYPILEKYLIKGTVEIWNCRKFPGFQVNMYAMFAGEGNYKWCGYFDADEFLEIGCYSNIKDYLNTIKEDCVSFNWINFGSNGQKHYKEGKLSERFPRPVEPIIYFKENCFIKSIVRGGDCWKGCWFNGSHLPYYEVKGNPCKIGDRTYNIGGYYTTNSYAHTQSPFRYKQGYIRHYYTKSFDEWMIKANRGWPDGTDNLKSSVFFGYETKSDFDFDRFIHAAFGEDSDYYDDLYHNSKFYGEVLDEYSVIQLANNYNLIYGVYINAICLMKSTTDHTFIVEDDVVDDSLFTLMLECAFYTGNRVVCARNHNEIWNAFLKYHNKNEKTYYIIST